jgi:hypothetical protein
LPGWNLSRARGPGAWRSPTRGRAGLIANGREITKVIWTRNSPKWRFDDATLDRAAVAFDNPDYVESSSTPTVTGSAWPQPFADAILEVTALRSQNALQARKD